MLFRLRTTCNIWLNMRAILKDTVFQSFRWWCNVLCILGITLQFSESSALFIKCGMSYIYRITVFNIRFQIKKKPKQWSNAITAEDNFRKKPTHINGTRRILSVVYLTPIYCSYLDITCTPSAGASVKNNIVNMSVSPTLSLTGWLVSGKPRCCQCRN